MAQRDVEVAGGQSQGRGELALGGRSSQSNAGGPRPASSSQVLGAADGSEPDTLVDSIEELGRKVLKSNNVVALHGALAAKRVEHPGQHVCVVCVCVGRLP